jgi:hypothetical protein
LDAIIPEASSSGKAPPSCTNLSQDPINTPCQEAKDPKSQLIWCCNSIVRLSVYDERGTKASSDQGRRILNRSCVLARCQECW